jgi:hypothetical protein
MSENRFTVPAKTTEDERKKKKTAETKPEERKPAGSSASSKKSSAPRKTVSKTKTGTAAKPRTTTSRKTAVKSSTAKDANYEQPELFDVIPSAEEKPKKRRSAKTSANTGTKPTTAKSTEKTKTAEDAVKPQKEKTGIEEKPKTRFRVETEKPSLEANLIPDMSLLSAAERHRMVMKQGGEKKPMTISEPVSKTAKNDEYEHSVMLETIKSTQKIKREEVKIPELGHRTAKRKKANCFFFGCFWLSWLFSRFRSGCLRCGAAEACRLPFQHRMKPLFLQNLRLLKILWLSG